MFKTLIVKYIGAENSFTFHNIEKPDDGLDIDGNPLSHRFYWINQPKNGEKVRKSTIYETPNDAIEPVKGKEINQHARALQLTVNSQQNESGNNLNRQTAEAKIEEDFMFNTEILEMICPSGKD